MEMSTVGRYEGDDPTLQELQEKADKVAEAGITPIELGEAVPEASAASSESEDLEDKTVEELKDMARDLGVSGFSTMNKAELIVAVEEAQEEE